ncbi:MAG: hypothetical protein IKX62_03275 [Bacteroidales bacterium]|nr:hypothetical protein [Bacteroidales bacterium]
MDEKFIRRQPLAIDQEAEARVKEYINAYAASSEGHPFAGYGDDIKLETYELCPIYVVSLRTQYDKRYVNRGQYPFKNTTLPVRTVFKESDVDPWSFKMHTTDRFVEDNCTHEVDGSQHVETCGTCSGKGELTCSKCDGRGLVTCSSCGGDGTIRCTSCGGKGGSTCSYCHGTGGVQQSYEESYTIRDYTGREQIRYRTKYKTVTCSHCRGKGTIVCSSCGGNGNKVCRECGGSGELVCGNCHGTGKVTCQTCKGCGRLVHAIYVDQKLYNTRSKVYFFDPRVRDVAEIYEKDSYRGQWVLDRKEERLERGFFRGESEMAEQLDGFLDKHAEDVSTGCHILFQQAGILRVDAWWVEYTYEGKHYDGVISEDHFYAGVSPITEFGDEVLEKVDKALGGTGTLKARKLVEQAESLDVYDNRARVQKLRELVEKHLNTLYRLGTDLMFWLIALFVTPFLYNFYDSLNPVLRYAHFTNDPAWAPYSWLPAVQCVIFLILLLLARIVLNVTNHGKDRHVSVFGFILAGMGVYLLISLVILAVLLGLNYLGVSIVTTWTGFAVWRVIRFFLFAVVLIIALLVELVKWLWGLIF